MDLNLQITGALHPRIIHSDHRSGPVEYQISKRAPFFPSREEMATCKGSGSPKPMGTSSEALLTPPFPWIRSLGSGPTVPNSSLLQPLHRTGSDVGPVLLKFPGRGRLGLGKSQQSSNLWLSSKPTCFQVYFILHCTLLIKWTFNPFEKPHGAQIHLANLSFPPGVYLD